jgi:hypothetical protein
MRKKCVHELTAIMGLEDLDLEDLDLEDLDLDLDNYLLHPQPQHGLRVVHAFMHDRTIQHVVEERVEIDGGVLRQEQLIWCIKRQQQQQRALSNLHFKLRAMFLYNMDLEPDELREWLHSKEPPQHGFIVPISAVEDVAVQPTIPMFAGMNALHIMYEAAGTGCDAHSHHAHSHNAHSSKKRVVISHSKKHKSTRRA